MKKFTKSQLIAAGFAPSAARAKMLIPFEIPLACTKDEYCKLPEEIQSKYNPVATGPVHRLCK